MSGIRRSQRIRDKSSREDEHSDSEDEHSNLVQTDEQTHYEDQEENSTEDEDANDNDEDDDYQEPSAKKKRKSKATNHAKNIKKPRINTTSSAKTTASKRDQEHYLQMLQEFTPTELFETIANSEDVSVEEAANNWLDEYAQNRNKAMQEFVNFILNCCGCLVRVEEHDVVSNESSNETVGEIQLMFQEQKIHEFHLLMSKTHKKRAKYKPLYQNFTDFMMKLIQLANDRDFFYTDNEDEGIIETSPLVLDLLTWLSSFSVCKIRCLRYVATLAMYSFQDYLTELIVDLEDNYLSKLRKQLAMEQKKKRPNEKTLDKLETTVSEIQDGKTVIESNIDNIVKLCFVHRFKDVDDLIRAESMLHLAIWLENYPEYFFKVTFLKYFGWLLSDSSVNVRLQVLKILSQLVKFTTKRSKHVVDNSALRQFFERFKQRILEICLKDIDLQVRLAAVQVLVGINSFGYLEDSEIMSVTSLIFYDHEVKISSTAKNVKFLNAVAKFFSTVENEQTENLLESIELPKSPPGLDSKEVIETGIFIRFLIKSLSAYLQNASQEVLTIKRVNLLFQASEFLQPYFGNSVDCICRLLMYDGDFDEFKIGGNDVDQEQDDDQEQLLLPQDENDVVQYITVLSGLCHGGVQLNKSQSKNDTAKAILPHLEKLFERLPLESETVISQLLKIFQLFNFEDWITNGQEKAFHRITETIVKRFSDTDLRSGDNGLKSDGYASILKHFKDIDLQSTNILWKNQINHIKLLLVKFLQEGFRDLQEDINGILHTMYGVYIDKLVLLGKVFPLEFDREFFELIFEKFVRPLPHWLSQLTLETSRATDFKVFTLYAAWNLQSWYEIFNSHKEESAVSRSALDLNKFLIDELSASLVELSNTSVDNPFTRFHLEHQVGNTLSDILTASKVFELNLPEKEYRWKQVVENDYQLSIGSDVTRVLLDVFLHLESLYANRRGVQLDRFDEEDVNLNDLGNDSGIADVEKELCLFTIKLKSLLKLGFMGESTIENRILLNKDALGGFFKSIVEDAIFTEEQTKKPAMKTVQSGQADSTAFDHEELGPIEEFSEGEIGQTRTQSEDMLDNDPIEDSQL